MILRRNFLKDVNGSNWSYNRNGNEKDTTEVGKNGSSVNLKGNFFSDFEFI